MNLKRSMPLVAAVVLGLVAMIMARSALEPTAPQKVTVATTPVVVAVKDVPIGKDLAADDLAVAQIPSNVAPAKSFTTVSAAVGRSVETPLVKGQAVIETLLAPEGSGDGLRALVPNGMRAMTMNIDEVTGLAGMIQPGCRVDVMAIVPDEKSKQQSARTVLQNIKILAVGRQLGPPPTDGTPQPASNNLTFLVTPEQARILQLAASTSRPWLVLRSGRDGAPLAADRTLVEVLHGTSSEDGGPTTKPTTMPIDMAVAPAPRPARRRDAVRVVQVIRGGVVTQVTLPAPDNSAGVGAEGAVQTAATADPATESSQPTSPGAASAPKIEKTEAVGPAAGAVPSPVSGDGLKAAPEGLPGATPRPNAQAGVSGADPSDAVKADPFGSDPQK